MITTGGDMYDGTTGGDMYYAAHPECPEHGQMSYRQPPPGADRVWPPGTWVCHGWDGEGCDHTVTENELDWKLLGHAEEGKWKIDWTPPWP